jgi:hypothetical protein
MRPANASARASSYVVGATFSLLAQRETGRLTGRALRGLFGELVELLVDDAFGARDEGLSTASTVTGKPCSPNVLPIASAISIVEPCLVAAVTSTRVFIIAVIPESVARRSLALIRVCTRLSCGTPYTTTCRPGSPSASSTLSCRCS